LLDNCLGTKQANKTPSFGTTAIYNHKGGHGSDGIQHRSRAPFATQCVDANDPCLPFQLTFDPVYDRFRRQAGRSSVGIEFNNAWLTAADGGLKLIKTQAA